MSEETKCYVFTCDASCTVKVVVYAKDLDTAHQNCNLLNCDDYEITEMQIEDIKDYSIEED